MDDPNPPPPQFLVEAAVLDYKASSTELLTIFRTKIIYFGKDLSDEEMDRDCFSQDNENNKSRGGSMTDITFDQDYIASDCDNVLAFQQKVVVNKYKSATAFL